MRSKQFFPNLCARRSVNCVMVMKATALWIFMLLSLSSFSQNIFTCVVKDDETQEPLSNVSATLKGTGKGSSSDINGKIILKNIPNGKQTIIISSIGYKDQTLDLIFPLSPAEPTLAITLEQEEKEMEHVIISSSRTDSRIENTPTRVEVIGTEEVEEESGVKPSNISSLLGDIAGVQSQQTSAVTGNTDLRIQGLPGDYTQILKDGMPLFGGYAGSFSILQIPPLDLKQVEIIKGASSTLYGGGAIAGMINIISKTPKLDKRERLMLLNQTSLGETNLNLYLSERNKAVGYTFFAGGNFQKQVDINRDGFSDAGRTESAFLHPTFFFYPNERNTISVGVNSTFEDRKGGDMEVLGDYFSNIHQFYIENQTYRNTFDLIWNSKFNQTDKLTVKGTTSSYNRNISTSVFGMRAKQLSWFSEASFVKRFSKNDLVAGMNFNGERLKKGLPDSTMISDYNNFTVGFFLQDDWRIHPKLIIETGLRTDFHNIYKAFVLPRISILYKINPAWTMRLGGGLGYKTPTVFESSIDERDYMKIRPLDTVKAEKSAGANWDFNFRKKFGKVTLAINQSFYYTQINDPLVKIETPTSISFHNASKPITTDGFETWLQISWKGLDAYLGYTLTDARKKYDAAHPYLDLSARDKFASVISYEFSKRFRICSEATYVGSQYLEDGTKTPGFPIFAFMIRYDIKRFSFTVNGENLNDYRQTKKENIVMGPFLNPTFKQLWAPIDGRIFNLSVKINLD